MRYELADLEGKKVTVVGEFHSLSFTERKGSRKGYGSIRLTNVVINEKIHLDHLWAQYRLNQKSFTKTKTFMAFNKGKRIELSGTVEKYERADGSIDYTVCNVGFEFQQFSGVAHEID